MPLITVKYSKEVTETLNWPEDEMGDFDYDTLEANLSSPLTKNRTEEIEYGSITSVKINGKEHEF